MIEMGTMCCKAGTPAYVSPEVINGDYNIDCDMSAAGCVLYVMLAGYPPFYGANEIELKSNIMKGYIEFDGDEWKNVSRDAINLINKLINKPQKRLTADEALKHKWFKKQSKNKDSDEEELVIDTSKLKNMKRRHTAIGQMAMSNISVNVSPD